jgi:hypothetical protein
MAGIYECTSCGVVASRKAEVCSPQEVSSRNEYCGEAPATIEAMCEPMRKNLEYECSSCGRPAADPELVCAPDKKR